MFLREKKDGNLVKKKITKNKWKYREKKRKKPGQIERVGTNRRRKQKGRVGERKTDGRRKREREKELKVEEERVSERERSGIT